MAPGSQGLGLYGQYKSDRSTLGTLRNALTDFGHSKSVRLSWLQTRFKLYKNVEGPLGGMNDIVFVDWQNMLVTQSDGLNLWKVILTF